MNLKITGNSYNTKLWVLIVLYAVLSVVFFTEHGEKMISAYYANREQESMFNEKKLSRVIGFVMALLAVLLLVMAVCGSMIPNSYMRVFPFLTILVLFAGIVIAHTTCRK